MKKYENPKGHTQISFLLDPLGIRSKMNISRKIIALLCPIGMSLLFVGAFLNNASHPQTFLIIMSMIGGIMYMISWFGAILNSIKAGRWGWTIFVLLPFFLPLIIYCFAGPDAKPDPNKNEISA